MSTDPEEPPPNRLADVLAWEYSENLFAIMGITPIGLAALENLNVGDRVGYVWYVVSKAVEATLNSLDETDALTYVM
jgi:hypothetical protein